MAHKLGPLQRLVIKVGSVLRQSIRDGGNTGPLRLGVIKWQKH